MDADPVRVSAAGRIFQVRPDAEWLRHVQPGLVEAVERMLGGIGPEGLASGYEGTFAPTFGPLYAIAIEQGLLDPLEPEWWPAEATPARPRPAAAQNT